MEKLLAAYRARPTFAAALKLATYDRLHPMAVCMLSREDQETLTKAKAATSLNGRLEIMVVR
jgi:hypothetical protein